VSLVEGDPRLVAEPLASHPACFYCRAGHPLLTDPHPSPERILRFPFVGTRIPPRIARHFLSVAQAGRIDPDTGDYVPPLRVDTLWMAREVVLASDAVTGAPVVFFDADVQAGRLVRLRVAQEWARTAYGFVARRDAVLSPAAERFKDEVRAIEVELVAAGEAWLRAERRAGSRNGARRRPAAAA